MGTGARHRCRDPDNDGSSKQQGYEMSTGWPSAGHPGGGLTAPPGMRPPVGPPRPGARRYSRALALGAVGLVTVVLLVTGLQGAARPTATPVPPTIAARASPAVTRMPSPVPTDRTPAPSASPAPAWARLVVPELAPVAELAPTDADAGGVALTSAFTLTSRTSERAIVLAGRLSVEPAIDLATEAPGTGDASPVPVPSPGGPGSGDSVTIRPRERLAPGHLYRFALNGADGSLRASWAFQTKQPLHVTGTLPADRATGVPVDTGIEITFDQDGVSGAAAHLSISPSVTGTFEQHGRVLVFAPAALQPRTVYAVTLGRGVGLSGSDQVLEEDVRFAFETGGAAGDGDRPTVDFARRVYESATREAPVLTVYAGGTAVGSLPVAVYRFASLDACLAALREVASAPTWTAWQAPGALVPTAGMPRAIGFTAHPQSLGPDDGRFWFRVPARLGAGWYLVEARVSGRTAQAFLQITDIATFAATTATRSVVWVNDLATGQALPGATVLLDGTKPLGTSGENGVALFVTPGALARVIDPYTDAPATPTPSLVVRAPGGRAAFVALGTWGPDTYGSWWPGSYSGDYGASDRYWQLLYTDRTVYRQTDTLHAWGTVRDRDSGLVPDDLELRLVMSGGDSATPPVATLRPIPGTAGAFSATIALRDLPLGGYDLQVWSGGAMVADRYLQVDILVKPAYTVTGSTDRRVYVSGDSVTTDFQALFYDGTPVPGVDLQANWGNDSHAQVTTDDAGHATIATTADQRYEGSQMGLLTIMANPVQPEEAAMAGAASALVLSSDVFLEATATVASGRVHVAGSILDVDVPELERTWDPASGWWAVSPPGSPRPDAAITAVLTEQVATRTRTGQTYDFIAKKAVPVYQVEVHDVARGTYRVRSAADGTFVLDIPVAGDAEGWTVSLRAADAKGRTSQLDVYADRARPAAERTRPYLEGDGPPRNTPGTFAFQGGTCDAGLVHGGTYGVGDTVRVVMRDGAGALPSAGANRYLFLTEQRGLRATSTGTSSRFAVPFDGSAVPNLVVSAVRFTGTSYQAAIDGFVASVDTAGRAIDVVLTPDAARYRPGGSVTLDVSTRRAMDGSPVAAAVTLSAVDEKLFDIGAAVAETPLADLYLAVPSGLRASYASHEYPTYLASPGCGSTTGGGGGRTDFRDSLLYRQVRTDASGHARVTFGLSDDLTSWHVSASAITADLDAGSGWIGIPVGLPFFVDATLAAEYLAADRPVLRVRAYGESLHRGDQVTFTISSATLPMAPVTLTAPAFGSTEVELPPLRAGTQSVVIEGRAGTGAGARTDRLTRTFRVVATRLLQDQTAFTALGPAFRPEGGSGATTYVFTDAGRGRFLATLRSLAWGDGPRLDQALAALVARSLEKKWFPSVPLDDPVSGFEPARYQLADGSEADGGLALLPYATPDLELSALAALAAPDSFDRGHLDAYFAAIAADPTSSAERVDIAVAGMAALGDPVLSRLQAEARPDGRTVIQRLWLALGMLALGDDGTARAIERDLLAASGETYGAWIRLRVGETGDDALRATSLLAMLAAGLGDPLAEPAEAYVEANPGTDVLASLGEAVYAGRAIERAAPAAASFAYVVGGRRQTVQLETGESFSVTLTAAQRATFSAERLSGDVDVTTDWQAPLDAATATLDPSLHIERSVSPVGTVGREALVRVRFEATFGAQSPSGCYHLVESVPSGLVPLPWDPTTAEVPTYTPPYLVQGQAVHFCISPGDRYPPGYVARVASAGTYAWEPAVLQPAAARDRIAMTGPTTITIR